MTDLKLENGEYGNVVNIRYLPTCGHCGFFLDPKEVYVVRVRGIRDHVTPERCPNCGAFFSGIILHTPKEVKVNETG